MIFRQEISISLHFNIRDSNGRGLWLAHNYTHEYIFVCIISWSVCSGYCFWHFYRKTCLPNFFQARILTSFSDGNSNLRWHRGQFRNDLQYFHFLHYQVNFLLLKIWLFITSVTNIVLRSRICLVGFDKLGSWKWALQQCSQLQVERIQKDRKTEGSRVEWVQRPPEVWLI